MAQRQENEADGVHAVAEAAAHEDIVRPRRPHDDLTFDELSRRYNFRLTSGHALVFTRLVLKECQARPSPVRVLDVGCGRGIGRCPDYQRAIRQHADEYWGIDPDVSVAPPEGLFDHHEHALMETARLPADHFDVAYSYMVMEHAADPDRFMGAMARCLKPGGVYILTTPNRRHYFAHVARTLHALRLDDLVLRIVRQESPDAYHYPLQYRFNDERRIAGCAERLGLLPPEFAYIEAKGPISYCRKLAMPLYHLLALKRRIFRQPKSLIGLVCRITKP